MGCARTTKKENQLGSHKAPRFCPKNKRGGRGYTYPPKDDQTNNGLRRQFNLKRREKKILAKTILLHQPPQYYRLRDELRHEQPAHPCNEGPSDESKVTDESREPCEDIKENPRCQ